MRSIARARWRGLVEGLWFVPSLIVVALGVLAVALIRLDRHAIGGRTPWVFSGSGSAARIVLETLAGSLITVAGLTFSVTMVVLQLASSQFSPRVLPNFLGDRVTQITVGTFVGLFVFCLIGLRAVGGPNGFVPRLTVTVGSALGVAAVILLIVFIHHISTMIQVSGVAGRIGGRTLEQVDALFPDEFAEEDGGADREALLGEWRSRGDPGRVRPERAGYVQEVDLDAMAGALDDGDRLHVPLAPGDFVSGGMAIADVWPPEAAEAHAAQLRRAITITNERNLAQDVDFGIRQLADIALRAISPSVNDPTTAVTCIGYVRSVLERLAGRALPARVVCDDGGEIVAIGRRRDFDEYLTVLLELARYVDGDERVGAMLVNACEGIAAAAEEAGAEERAAGARRLADRVSERAGIA